MNFEYYIQELNNNLLQGSERSHYPSIKNLMDNQMLGISTTIEEKGNQAGIPDFTVRKNNNLLGYIEAKKIGENLDNIEQTEQIIRYLESSIGQNFILTNYLEFRWYQQGNLQLTATVGEINANQITINSDLETINNLIDSFLNYQEKIINNYNELAEEMATVTKAIRFSINEALKEEEIEGNNKSELSELKLVFQDLLLPDLDNRNFADMYAQTIAYGLFTARVGHQEEINQSRIIPPNPPSKGRKLQKQDNIFNRENTKLYISDKIPFLKGLFDTVISTNIVSKINWTVEILIELLAKADMANILDNFGQETQKQDPVVHFYETFLGAYSADLRKSRGVYYTPEPVVSFIVKAVNDILENDFNLDEGLGSKNVTILDPATGTGTFLYEVIKQICYNIQRYSLQTDWDTLFKQRKVIERLFGFELLMTPYTIAHLKLGLFLKTLNYKFAEGERLNIFLTNTLDEGIKKSEFLLANYISEEANQAANIKNKTTIHVVIGNPPYAGHSENNSAWIDGLIRDYYQVDGVDLQEKNPKWLQDDYVKFIRFGEWRISQTGVGILAFVTNHGFIDNPTFRGMRQHLMNSFNRIYLVNLHGNAKKKEVAPDGNPDKNVFDIQQGVSIIIAVKDIPKDKTVWLFNREDYEIKHGIFYYDLWGSREHKYEQLKRLSLNTIQWEDVNPQSPFYLFTPQDTFLLEEYNQGWKITDIMPVNSVGIVTARDKLTIQNSPEDVEKVIKDFVSLSQEEAREKYNLGEDTRDWKVNFAQNDIRQSGTDKNLIVPILYRPFDLKYTYYTGHSRGFLCMPRNEVMRNMLIEENLGLITCRQQSLLGGWFLVGITENIIESCVISNKTKEINYLFPLYIYPEKEDGQGNIITEKEPNFSPDFIKAISQKLGYQPTPEKIFYYIYGLLHSPNYRQRYAQFLKIDFPRIPLTTNNELFNQLADKGEILVNLHLFKQLPEINLTQSNFINEGNLPIFAQEEKGEFHYQGDGKNEITKIQYDENKRQIFINQNCYFTGVDMEIWQFRIGGYQVLDKWLKNRKKANLNLTSTDITYYQKIIIVLKETIKIMTEIDQIIGKFPLE